MHHAEGEGESEVGMRLLLALLTFISIKGQGAWHCAEALDASYSILQNKTQLLPRDLPKIVTTMQLHEYSAIEYQAAYRGLLFVIWNYPRAPECMTAALSLLDFPLDYRAHYLRRIPPWEQALAARAQLEVFKQNLDVFSRDRVNPWLQSVLLLATPLAIKPNEEEIPLLALDILKKVKDLPISKLWKGQVEKELKHLSPYLINYNGHVKNAEAFKRAEEVRNLFDLPISTYGRSTGAYTIQLSH